MQIRFFENQYMLQVSSSSMAVDLRWFQPKWLERNRLLVGSSSDSGRNPAHFFQIEQQEYVLRHYWRGGLPGKVLRDSYLYLGLTQSRPYKELALMEKMWQLRLPVAKPIAALVTRSFGRYSGDLITIKLPESQDLVTALSEQPLATASWQQLGRTLAQFHQAGVYHADLNARNILLSRGSFHLIDFDRGELRAPKVSWQQANLDRLRRSLRKEQQRVDGLCFDDATDWAALIAGYQASKADASAN